MPRKSTRKPKRAARKTKVSATGPKKAAAKPSPKKAKSPLSGAERKQFRLALILRKKVLSGAISSLEAEGLRRSQAASGELSSMPIHLADLGSDAFEQELTLGRMESESDELQEIAEALERIKDGSFGLCETCGKSIPKARLKAIPYARLCVPCKQKEEGV